MIVMPSNASGWFWHTLARETGRLGHLYSPGAQRGPWPWFPYALDNGAFSCWSPNANKRDLTFGPALIDRTSGTLLLGVEATKPVARPTFDDEKWAITERAWHRLITWAQIAPIKPLWAIVPDVPGEAARTFERWAQYAPGIRDVPLALAVQDGMTTEQVQALHPPPVCNRGRRLDRVEVGHCRALGEGFPSRPPVALQRASSALRPRSDGRRVLRRNRLEPRRPEADERTRGVGSLEAHADHHRPLAVRLSKRP